MESLYAVRKTRLPDSGVALANGLHFTEACFLCPHRWLWLWIAHFSLGAYSSTATAEGFVSFLNFGLKKATTRKQQHKQQQPTKNQPSNQNQDLCTRKVSLLRHIFLLVLIFVPAGFVFQITESIRNILHSTACISHKSFFGYRRQGENCWIHFWVWPVSHWSGADHMLHLQKHLSYCYSKKLSGHQISLLLTKKTPQKLRKIVMQANFLRFLILVYMDDIFIFKYLCLCQQIFFSSASAEKLLFLSKDTPLWSTAAKPAKLNLCPVQHLKGAIHRILQKTQTEIFQLPPVKLENQWES